jgi:hypothetical protein
VQDASAANIRAALGVALREFPLKKGFADYLLYVDGKEIALMMQSFIYDRLSRFWCNWTAFQS